MYKAPLINWSGCSSSGINYSEIIAERLISDGIVGRILAIPEIERQNYKVDTHDGKLAKKTMRKEEIFAKELFDYCSSGDKQLNAIGKIIDYQVPLKASLKDKGIGKIDLIAYCKKPIDIVYLLELKYKDNKETLLRCVLEISTYFRLLHKTKFLASYPELKHLRSDNIRTGILVFNGSAQHKEIEEMTSGKRPQMEKLFKTLTIDIFLIKTEYIVEQVQ
ncbi:MAG: hypothetical protein AABY50_10245 [Nitrospirota bacterium]